MVDAVVSFTIGKLNEFVTQQVNIRTGVKDDIESLKNELGYLLISINAAEARQDLAHIRQWIGDVKDVANEAVIILERFNAQQEAHAAHKQGGGLNWMRRFISKCKKEPKLFDIGKNIKSLKERVDGIKNRRDEYRINDTLVATQTLQRRKRTLLRATSFDHEKDVVGFEDDTQTLLAQLVNGDPSLSFISIHGMGGLGKSTLANKLYHSSELSHFKTRAWVCVSEEYDIAHVLRKILYPFLPKHEQNLFNILGEVELLRNLQRILLDGDQYLVVIDDIWHMEFWKRIQNAFPDKKDGSRVIITTRNKNVAESVHDTCFVHELRFLREQESWRLFSKRAKPTPNLVNLGNEMVDKCGGLPLAIVILSGLLLQKKTHTFWSHVNNHLWRRLKGTSSEIQDILNLSYDDLSIHMRQCFLYLARYPEDHAIQVFNLKLLWIAEEFVSEDDEEDGVVMEDVAEDYLNELINRNMIQISLQSAEGQVLECRVHDLVRDLAIHKAKEHKIMGIFDSSKQHPNPIRLLQGQSRHAIYNDFRDYLKLSGPSSDDLNLRSLVLTNKTAGLEAKELRLMCTRFKYLKVLDLTSVTKSQGIPQEIGDLVLLKFLGLMGADLLVIPPSIGKLKKLQTFCSPINCSYKYKFPEEISKLKELRHLVFYDVEGNFSIGSEQRKLQTLIGITYAEWLHIDTINLTNLHTLNIQGGERKEENGYNLESLANLTSLRKFSMYFKPSYISTIQPLSSCKHLTRVKLMGKIKDPAELSFLPDSVTEVVLMYTELAEDPLPALGSLSNLTALRLAFNAFSGEKMVCSADAFPCLQFLELGKLLSLQQLQVNDGALPSLKAFEIFSCDRIKMDQIPQRITSLPPVPNFWGHLGSR